MAVSIKNARPGVSGAGRLYGGTALAALAWATLAGGAWAQQTPAPTDSTAVDEVIVTGSRIQRRDADSVGPVLTLTAEDIRNSGSTSVGDLLQKLPSAGVSLNSNGTQGTSYGASSINLRYLGGAEGSGNRVLVLVDGHRWVDGVGQRGFRDFVDLNTMPLGMIEGIEVLKDGASAIYGADAIAGVVNIQTLRDFDGTRVNSRYGTTDRGDGEQFSTIVNWGRRFDNSALVFSASYVKDSPINTEDRDLTRVTLVPATSAGTSPSGLFILPGLSNNAYFGTGSGFASSSAPITANALAPYGAGTSADNSFHTASLPGDYYNTQAQGIYTTGPSERYGFYGRYRGDLTDTLSFHAEALFNRRVSDQLFSPVSLDIGGTSGTVRGFSLPSTHAFNPFGTANGVPIANALNFASTQAWRVRKVMSDLGNRDNIQDVKTYRFGAGFDGEISLMGREFTWDAYGSYARNEMKSSALNGVNYENLFLGLGNPATCAATPGCVPVNLFGPMTDAAADYIRFTTRETNSTEIYDLAFNITGEVLELPAGPLAVAAGYEYRQNKATDTPDAYANRTPTYLSSSYATTTAQTRVPTAGQYSLHETYLELAVPVLRDVALAESLDLSLAARYSNYDTVGSATTLKAGVGWRPVHDLLVRGTYSQGFRAPSILELFQGGREVNLQVIDPCNGGAVANPTLIGCAGVPGGYNQINFNLNGLIPGTTSGNPDLEPETADTYSFGFALKPHWIPGLTITTDWYDIRIKDAIASQAPAKILSLCSTRGGVYCDLITRDAGTGAILNLGQGAQNLNEIRTSGVDATIRYEFDTEIGRFAAVVDTSYLSEFTTIAPDPNGGAPIVDERAGKGDRSRSTYPHWKGQTSLRWSNGDWSALWRGRYIGESTDVVNTVKDAKTDAVFYQDLEAGYRLEQYDATVTVGINNLFDVMPPASYANAPINFDIYTYDVRGRSAYVRLGFQF
ncbi:TonB-dependent receptor [Brevundimonas sp.]|uniref:TonB-dependent receptor n=1 Tax=Brevundimonas sp. TaxID=1871086 RepID=UPI002489FA4D|nr:TonB-dependent receptor [Brevundimonas sp.]MDI1280694.1 TonB-dependent receptor [Brevundimonas sp.]